MYKIKLGKLEMSGSELLTLVAMHNAFGRVWKSRIVDMWTCGYGELPGSMAGHRSNLQALRNRQGMTGLDGITTKKLLAEVDKYNAYVVSDTAREAATARATGLVSAVVSARTDTDTDKDTDTGVSDSIEIHVGEYDSNHYAAENVTNVNYGDYVRHNIDVYNILTIGDCKLTAMYQTGCSFLHNEYGCPSPELELSEEGGTSNVLMIVDSIYESDFDDVELINEYLIETHALCPAIETVAHLRAVYAVLNGNLPEISNFVDDAVQHSPTILHAACTDSVY